MATEIPCPRCGHLGTFIKGFLPDTCVCRVCQSQLDWREIPGMGPDCRPVDEGDRAGGEAAAGSSAGGVGVEEPPPGATHA